MEKRQSFIKELNKKEAESAIKRNCSYKGNLAQHSDFYARNKSLAEEPRAGCLLCWQDVAGCAFSLWGAPLSCPLESIWGAPLSCPLEPLWSAPLFCPLEPLCGAPLSCPLEFLWCAPLSCPLEPVWGAPLSCPLEPLWGAPLSYPLKPWLGCGPGDSVAGGPGSPGSGTLAGAEKSRDVWGLCLRALLVGPVLGLRSLPAQRLPPRVPAWSSHRALPAPLYVVPLLSALPVTVTWLGPLSWSLWTPAVRYPGLGSSRSRRLFLVALQAGSPWPGCSAAEPCVLSALPPARRRLPSCCVVVRWTERQEAHRSPNKALPQGPARSVTLGPRVSA